MASVVAHEIFGHERESDKVAVTSVDPEEVFSLESSARRSEGARARGTRGDFPKFCRSWRGLDHPENEDTVVMPTRFGKTLFPRGPQNMHELCGDRHVSCWSELDADASLPLRHVCT